MNNSYTVQPHTKYRGKHCCVFECNFAFLLLLAVLAGLGSKLKKAHPTYVNLFLLCAIKTFHCFNSCTYVWAYVIETNEYGEIARRGSKMGIRVLWQSTQGF